MPEPFADAPSPWATALICAAQAADVRADYRVSSRGVEAVLIFLDNGPNTRMVQIGESRAAGLLGANLSGFAFIGVLDAFLDKASDVIEAAVSDSYVYSLRNVPGWTGPDEPEQFPQPIGSLRVESDGRSIEISEPSPLALSLLLGTVRATIKLKGFGARSPDEAQEILDGYARGFLFDLDSHYGVGFSLLEGRSLGWASDRSASPSPPEFPRYRYSPAALTLYAYGRDSRRQPLLQFLTYYQAIEYHFASFVHSRTLSLMKDYIDTPGFDIHQDSTIEALLAIARKASSDTRNERQQLRAVVESVTTEESLAAIVAEIDTSSRGHFTERSTIRGTRVLRIHDGTLREQVTDRIYDLRCRIVHSKAEFGDGEDSPLLPGTTEARRMRPEIELLKLLAQRTIAARATGLQN